jgi:hypothetical protein
MEHSDLTTMREMQREIGLLSGVNLGQLAERLLRLRDGLCFDDADWYHDLTQQVATLDSASTFHPANDAEKRQLDAAIQQAVDQIMQLISTKLR